MTVRPTIISDEQVSNALVKVSREVVRWNMDKAATIRAHKEEIKTKDGEIARLTQERDLVQQKNSVFISIVEEIGDNVIRFRPHLEPKVPKMFPLAIHYIGTLVELVLEDEPLCMPVPRRSN